MDNSPIQRKKVIRELVEAEVYQLLFLPKYSPDFNEIKHDFSTLKNRKISTYLGEFYPIFAQFCKNGSGDHIHPTIL